MIVPVVFILGFVVAVVSIGKLGQTGEL